MPVFFNKSELIFIMLVLLMFDMNAFMDASTQYIVHDHKMKFAELLVLISILLYDFYTYKSLINMKTIGDTDYRVEEGSASDCPEYVDSLSRKSERELRNLKDRCYTNTNNRLHRISYNIVSCFTLASILVLFFMTLLFGKKIENSRPLSSRFLHSIPSIITGIIIVIYSFVG